MRVDIDEFHARCRRMSGQHVLRRLAEMTATAGVEQKHHVSGRISSGVGSASRLAPMPWADGRAAQAALIPTNQPPRPDQHV